MINNFKKYYIKHKTQVISSAVIALVIIALFITLMVCDLRTSEIYYSSEKAEDNVGPIFSILNGYSVSQTFICHKRDLYGFALNFATYGGAECIVTVKLTDITTDKIVFERNIQANTILDNAYLEFLFDPVKNCKDHTFKIDIYATNGNDIVSMPTTLWAAKGDAYPGTLVVNGAERENDVNLRLYTNKSFGFNNTILITATAIALAYIANKHITQYKNDMAACDKKEETSEP